MLRKTVVPVSVLAILALGLLHFDMLGSQTNAAFVGSEACRQCHEEEATSLVHTSHGRAAGDSTVVGSSLECESCHGPGSLHVEAAGDRSHAGFATVRNFRAMPPEESAEFCLGCHKQGEQFHWDRSAHARQDVSCVSCHSVHEPEDPSGQKLLRNADTNELCLGCHQSKRLGLSRSAHMPLNEGAMDCASCHNPHGSPGEPMLRANSVNELCESCHADKRGPMLWEHPPVRENCVTCHEPHGSNNDKVLAGRRPYLCQTCHVVTRHPSTLYDFPDLQTNRVANRSCTNCHSQVHGSNHPSGKFFTR